MAAVTAGEGWQREAWGTVEGREVGLHTLTNRAGMRARIGDYGATLVGLTLPDGTDVVLGLEALHRTTGSGYSGTQPYLGAVIGRVANRVAGASFELAGRRVRLAANEGTTQLHGGPGGFAHRVWSAQPLPDPEAPGLALSYLSEDGEEGYPGRVWAGARYGLGPGPVLSLELHAVADALTPVALTHHPYFNLAGHDAGRALGQRLTVAADHYTPADDSLIPTGEVRHVAGTPFDLRHGPPLADAVESGTLAGGYDINLLVTGPRGVMRRAAMLEDPASGRRLELWSTQPALQVYSGGGLDGSLVGKDGARYQRFAGVALEAQAIPNVVNLPHLPQVWLRPGERYRQRIEYRFVLPGR